MTHNTSSAYDLSAYQPLPTKQPRPRLEVSQKRSAKRTLSFLLTPSTAGAFMIVVTLLALMVYNQVCLNEISNQINEVQSDLTYLESEFVKMNSQMEAMASLQAIGEKARDELGLQRLDKYQTQYVNLYSQDKGTLSENPPGRGAAQETSPLAATIIRGIVEYISGN